MTADSSMETGNSIVVNSVPATESNPAASDITGNDVAVNNVAGSEVVDNDVAADPNIDISNGGTDNISKEVESSATAQTSPLNLENEVIASSNPVVVEDLKTVSKSIVEEDVKVNGETKPTTNGVSNGETRPSTNGLSNGEGGQVLSVNARNKKPLLALTAPPVTGHTSPLLRLASDMTKRGFEVIFMSTLSFKEAILRTGAEFYESTTPFAAEGYLESRRFLPPGLPTLMADMENMFIKQMGPRSAEFGSLLELIRERDPSRDVVIITETMSLAPMPFIYGAPLPKGYTEFPKTVNINTVPIMLLSIDTGITGPCLPPDASESGRARNKLMNEMLSRGPLGATDRVFHEALTKLNCTSLPKVFFQNAWLESYDTTFQLCVPSLEYPRSDLHRSIRFSGALPKRDLDPNFQHPSWWPEIKANASLPAGERKKIVAVAQGTVALDYEDLILPTLRGLAKRPDVIVVSILGVKGATLQASDGYEPADNARVIDHLPYDAILEYADIFITNGGYGGLSHGVLNGVPMILSGTSEDKAEVCARGAYAGFAINLRVQRPTSQQMHDACEKIFTDPSYKQRALRLMDENEDLECVSIFERQIMKYAKTT